MSNLDYEPIHQPQATSLGNALVIIGTIIATPIHFIVSILISFRLFQLAGGVTTNGRWTTYGGINYSWTNIAWLPGGILLEIWDGERSAPLGFLALLFLIIGSIVAAYLFASFIVRLFHRPRDFGRFNWRLWACLIAWVGWTPVPVKMTLTYWHTVAY